MGTPKRAYVEVAARLERHLLLPRGTNALRKAASELRRCRKPSPLCKELGHGVRCSQEPGDRQPEGEARGVWPGRDGGRPGLRRPSYEPSSPAGNPLELIISGGLGIQFTRFIFF